MTRRTLGLPETGEGYRSLSWSVPVSDSQAMQDIKNAAQNVRKKILEVRSSEETETKPG